MSGLTAPTLKGPRHILQRTSKFTRKLVESGPGGEMLDHASLLREVYEPSVEMSPGMVGLEDCESLSGRLRNEEAAVEKYLVRFFREPSRRWKIVSWAAFNGLRELRIPWLASPR